MYAGNHSTTGPFAPIVGVVRNVVGVKEFNQVCRCFGRAHSSRQVAFLHPALPVLACTTAPFPAA